MDSVDDPVAVVTPAKRRLRWACIRCLGRRSVTGEIYPEKNSNEPENRESNNNANDRKVKEAFFAGIFAVVSTIKAAYAELQFSHFPYDPDGIQSADEVIVSELKKLSTIRNEYTYTHKEMNHTSPETALSQFEFQERNNLLKVYEITIKKLDYQLKLKQSEIIFLKEKLSEAKNENRGLEKRLISFGPSPKAMPEIGGFNGLRLNNFCFFHRRAINSIRSFVRVLINLMDSANWDFFAAAEAILNREISFRKQSHLFLAIESFVCRVMFDGFNDSDIWVPKDTKKRQSQKRFFKMFLQIKQRSPFDYVSTQPNSRFASFCRYKYTKLVHPKMEDSLFNHLDQREKFIAGKLPETPFLSAFMEMSKSVWLLHSLAWSFDSKISVFQVSRGSRLVAVLMEGLGEEGAVHSGDQRVGFTVSPGFRAAGTLVQCQVYLC